MSDLIIEPDSEYTAEESASIVLVVEDNHVAREALGRGLKEAGYGVILAKNGQECLEQIHPGVCVVLLDLLLPDIDGFILLRQLCQKYPFTQVIVLSGSGVPEAVRSIKEGAFSYLQKPVGLNEVLSQVTEACHSYEEQKLQEYIGSVLFPFKTRKLPICTFKALDLREKISRLYEQADPILLHGEFGTGKGFLATHIHQQGKGASGFCFMVDCQQSQGMSPKDLLTPLLRQQKYKRPGSKREKTEGTLVLENVDVLQASQLAGIFSELQEKQTPAEESQFPDPPFRIIATTTRNPEFLAGSFPSFETFGFQRVQVLPLRERKEEIPELTQLLLNSFIEEGYPQYSIEKSAIEKLSEYEWPGNIEELRLCLRAATTRCNDQLIKEKHVWVSTPSQDGANSSLKNLVGRTLAEIEHIFIGETLKACNGKRAATAQILGVSEKTIYNKLKETPGFKRSDIERP